ncbi:glycoprotein [Riverside virus 1]|uniref:Glycoprotein n=1 Tax=Riverside virus 1 TaxID=1803263 RepID=A0A140D049_9RHAB|nr:glycoprotein [Riverside virus 1]AMJ52362.1 glycoprotein [Riverside virus 1]
MNEYRYKLNYLISIIIRIFTLIASISGSQSLEHQSTILFPTSDNVQWHEVTPNTLVCPIGDSYDKIESGVTIPVKLPLIGTTINIAGSVCTFTKLSTTCSKGFFGGITLELHTEPLDVSESLCREEIQRVSEGAFSSSEHPTPSCSWMKSSTTSRTLISVTSHSVSYNPYADAFKSSIFLTGLCPSSVCRTHFYNRLWISDHSIKESCNESQMLEGSLVIYYNTNHTVTSWSPDIYISEYDSPCTMNFCGRKGLRYPSGDWMALDRKDIPQQDWIGEYFYKIKDCPTGSQVNIINDKELIQNAVLSLLDEFLDHECEKVKDKITSGDMVSRTELQTLTPRYPGFHPVYRYSPGKFEMGLSLYQQVTVESSPNYPYIIIRRSDGRLWSWPYWIASNTTDIIDGPNGLYIKNKTLILGIQDIEGYKRIARLSSHYRVPLAKQSPEHRTRQLHPGAETEYTFVDDSALTDLHWTPMLYTLTAFVFTLFIGILLLMFWSKLVHCVKNKQYHVVKLFKKNTNDQEMEFYQPGP